MGRGRGRWEWAASHPLQPCRGRQVHRQAATMAAGRASVCGAPAVPRPPPHLCDEVYGHAARVKPPVVEAHDVLVAQRLEHPAPQRRGRARARASACFSCTRPVSLRTAGLAVDPRRPRRGPRRCTQSAAQPNLSAAARRVACPVHDRSGAFVAAPLPPPLAAHLISAKSQDAVTGHNTAAVMPRTPSLTAPARARCAPQRRRVEL